MAGACFLKAFRAGVKSSLDIRPALKPRYCKKDLGNPIGTILSMLVRIISNGVRLYLLRITIIYTYCERKLAVRCKLSRLTVTVGCNYPPSSLKQEQILAACSKTAFLQALFRFNEVKFIFARHLEVSNFNGKFKTHSS